MVVNFSGSPIFQRIELRAGESRRIRFDLDASAMSVVQADGRRVVDAGPAELWVGGGQPLMAAAGVRAPEQMIKLQVAGRAVLPPFGSNMKNMETRE